MASSRQLFLLSWRLDPMKLYVKYLIIHIFSFYRPKYNTTKTKYPTWCMLDINDSLLMPFVCEWSFIQIFFTNVILNKCGLSSTINLSKWKSP